MSKTLSIVLATLLLCLPPAFADTVKADAQAAPQAAAAPAACPPQARLALGSAATPTKCCEGHMGVCGCRAGKIVCCDGTASKDPNCTCHGDSGTGLAN